MCIRFLCNWWLWIFLTSGPPCLLVHPTAKQEITKVECRPKLQKQLHICLLQWSRTIPGQPCDNTGREHDRRLSQPTINSRKISERVLDNERKKAVRWRQKAVEECNAKTEQMLQLCFYLSLLCSASLSTFTLKPTWRLMVTFRLWSACCYRWRDI